ncbi:MAG: serine/threonine-protein kinase [Sandaracinaceae bacterium]
MSTLHADPLSTHAPDDDRAWYVERAAQVAMLLTVPYAGWWLLINALLVVGGDDGVWAARIRDPRHYIDLAIVLVLGVYGQAVLRAGKLSARALRTVDLVATMGFGVMAAVHTYSWQDMRGPGTELLLVLMLTYALVLRAALMPGAPKRTLVTGMAGWLAGVLTFLGLAVPDLVAPTRIVDPRITVLIGSTLLGVITVGFTVKLSQVLYGLRRQLKEAQQLGQYILESKIAEGGMGVIYRARHVLLRRPTALKLLRPELSDERSAARFEREVLLTSQLRHPNTVVVHDFGRTPDGVFYFAMELLDGVDLQTMVDRQGPLPVARMLYLFRQAASALSEAHGAGLIHRDVKPSNLFVSSAGPVKDWVKVLDFGLVREREPETSVGLSVAGAIVGTPLYMAPEQISDPDHIDTRADLYALGCTMYFALTGTPVFEGSLIEVCAQHLKEAPVPIGVRNPDVPPEVERLVASLLEKDPDERLQSAEELVLAIDRLAETHPWSARQSADAWEAQPSAPDPKRSAPPMEGLTVDLRGREVAVTRP